MQRMGMAINLNAEKVAEYKELHANAWPEVLEMIAKCNITNYSIFLKEPENLLFGYWEYTGANFAVDAARMAADPITQKWWSVCKPCQKPFDTIKQGEWWAIMEEVFHHD